MCSVDLPMNNHWSASKVKRESLEFNSGTLCSATMHFFFSIRSKHFISKYFQVLTAWHVEWWFVIFKNWIFWTPTSSHNLSLFFTQLLMTFWYVKHHKYFCEYTVQTFHLYPHLNHLMRSNATSFVHPFVSYLDAEATQSGWDAAGFNVLYLHPEEQSSRPLFSKPRCLEVSTTVCW